MIPQLVPEVNVGSDIELDDNSKSKRSALSNTELPDIKKNIPVFASNFPFEIVTSPFVVTPEPIFVPAYTNHPHNFVFDKDKDSIKKFLPAEIDVLATHAPPPNTPEILTSVIFDSISTTPFQTVLFNTCMSISEAHTEYCFHSPTTASTIYPRTRISTSFICSFEFESDESITIRSNLVPLVMNKFI